MLLDLNTRDEEFECRTFLLSVYTQMSFNFLSMVFVGVKFRECEHRVPKEECIFNKNQLRVLTMYCLHLVLSKV